MKKKLPLQGGETTTEMAVDARKRRRRGESRKKRGGRSIKGQETNIKERKSLIQMQWEFLFDPGRQKGRRLFRKTWVKVEDPFVEVCRKGRKKR